MGCGTSSSTKDSNKPVQEAVTAAVKKPNIGSLIIKVDVSKVKRIPEEQVEQFKKDYLSDAYLHPEDEGFNERMARSNELMYKRWEWVLANVETYVNMLRVKDFSDDQIQACLDGKRPLCFLTEEQHREFCLDLKELGKKLEKECNLKNIWFVQTGSAVPGFSTNPVKGIEDRPSRITDPHNSDVDIVVVAEGVKALVEAKSKEGVKMKEYPCAVDKQGRTDVRYGNRDLALVSKSLAEWAEEWGKKLGGGVQITFQDGNPVFPPWELPVPIKNYETKDDSQPQKNLK